MRIAWLAFRHAPWLSPLGFLKLAAALGLLHALLTLLGLRDCTSFLSGTMPAGEAGEVWLLLGAVYLLAYFAAVLLAPILVLGAGVLFVLERLARRRA